MRRNQRVRIQSRGNAYLIKVCNNEYHIYREKPKTLEEAQSLINEYIDYYNHERFQVKCACTTYAYEWRTMKVA